MKTTPHPTCAQHPRTALAQPQRVDDQLAQLTWYELPADGRLRRASLADTLSLKGLPGTPGTLAEKTGLCLGLGAVNGRVFQELARLGVGRLYGVDPDCNGRDSWLTQPIRRRRDRGRSKALTQARLAHDVNPACEICTLRGMAQDVPLWLYRQADVIIISTDNIEASVFAGNVAMSLGKDLIELAVFGESLAAFVRSFTADPQGACPACALSLAEWRDLKSRHGCDPSTMRALGQVPTRTQPMTCALAAQLGVAEALKLLLGEPRERRLAGEELIYSMVGHRVTRTPLARNPRCACPHEPWRLVDCPEAPSQLTLAELIDRYDRLAADTGAAADDAGPLQVCGELAWISYTLCGECGARVTVTRFGKPGTDLGHCRCGAPLLAVPLGVHAVLPQADLAACRNRPLDELGLPPGGAVRMAYDDVWTCFFVGDAGVPRAPAAAAW